MTKNKRFDVTVEIRVRDNSQGILGSYLSPKIEAGVDRLNERVVDELCDNIVNSFVRACDMAQDHADSQDKLKQRLEHPDEEQSLDPRDYVECPKAAPTCQASDYVHNDCDHM